MIDVAMLPGGVLLPLRRALTHLQLRLSERNLNLMWSRYAPYGLSLRLAAALGIGQAILDRQMGRKSLALSADSAHGRTHDTDIS